MPTYRITGPDGANYEIEAPEGASDNDVLAFVKSQTAAKTPETGALSAAAQGVGQGLTFGFADEIEGAARGGLDALTSEKSFSDAYSERVGNARTRLDAARNDQPLAFYGGEIGSALAVPGGLAKLGVKGALAKSADLGLRARSVAAAKEGAAYGAAYGAGTGEGEGKLTSAATGAALGGGFGVAFPATIDVAAAVGRGITNPIRGYANPQRVAAEKMGEAFARDLGASGTPGDVAVAMRKVQNTGQRASASDPQMMLADIGGDNVRRLSRQAFNMPNDRAERFRTVLDRRQVTAPRRIEEALRSTMADGKEFFDVTSDLVKARSRNADPAFTTGYQQPLSQQAIKDFQNFAQSRGYMQRIFEKTTESVQGMTGKTVDQMAPWEMLHRSKMEINREIGRLKRGTPDSKANWDVRDLTVLNQELGSLINKHNKPLGSALSRFSDESGLIRAVEDGLDDFKALQPEELARKMRGMPKAEADLYRVGATRALVQDIRRGSAWNDRTKSIFSSPEMNLKLKAIFPQAGERSQFMRTLDNERKKTRLRAKVMGGSQSDQNLITADEAGAPMKAAMTAAQAMTGRLQPALDMLARAGNRFSGITPGSANAMLDIAMTPAGKGLPPAVLRGLIAAAQKPGQRARTVEGLLAGFSSGLPSVWE